MISDLFHGKIPEILVADDTLDSLRLLSDTLSRNGYEVRSVTNGTLALASVRAVHPDLILLDIKMPDLSGYEVCQQLKSDPQTQDIPVIFISALHEPFDKVEAFNVGGVDYITKPFHIDEVLARIQNQLALRFSIAHIHQLNADLEQRVQDRTAQLERVNQSLQQEIIERRQIEQSLRESEAKFRQISEHIQEVFWLTQVDPEQGQPISIEYVSPAYEVIWGRTCEAVYNNIWDWTAAIHDEDRQRVQEASAKQTWGAYEQEYRVVRPDGSIRWIRDRGFPIVNADGKVYRVAGIAEDITAQQQAELERDRFFNLSLDLLFIANHKGHFKRLNPAWKALLGYMDHDLLEQSFWTLIHPDDQAIAHSAEQLLELGEDVTTLEMRCRCKDGSYLWIAWNAVPFLQENLIYGAGRNISQRKESEARLVHETLHDALTGLSNRTCFMERLAIAVKKSHRQPDSFFAVLFIDLDDFKRINDTLGHLIGDQLLIQISHILKESVRQVDSVARLGGDEFTILLEEVQDLKEVLNIVERIQERLQPSFRLGYHEIFTSASIGIVFGTSDYQNVADIVRDADIAMYRAKANGKGCYEVFDQAMYAQTLHLVELENCLRHAIANQELQLYYQPIVSLWKDRKLEGFEVLLRWQHPLKGLIPASEFIPIAENTGLINTVGEWVLQAACIQFKHWRSIYPGFETLYLSINISGRQLREPSLIATLDQILQDTQTPPHCLKLEITESSLIENTQTAAQILQEIQQRGIQISLDDFGTGFSSLRYLHQFPIDIIKIDRSFVTTVQQGDRERSIIHSIIMLARALDFATVAEGIETRYQLEQLQALGCDSGQGFLFSKPMPQQQLDEFLLHNGFITLATPSRNEDIGILGMQL
jgi:diguanylate cyclase (GGDEF)-like protein/PAS domain S-box-containing protein